MDIKKCVCIVTGGASGLGEACVRSLVADGAKVSIFDLNEDKGEEIASEMGEAVIFCKTDICDENNTKATIDKTVEAFGGIHVAINCAGVGIPGKVLGKEGPMSMKFFNQVVHINLMGSVNVIRLAAEKMVQNMANEEGERGVIINTSSGAAFEGQIGQAAYSASKAGIVGMTLPIAREFAEYGIRVIAIAPGLFDTPMMAGLSEKVRESLASTIPFPQRLGKPSEFAKLVRQTIENPMLNGCTIRIDGALRMAPK